eukprot:CAMPEP_0182451860 /NCGR_PEP_ID=MMETSP1172-20130603/43949_1 /TAXON_ID=708627 /ORGANISM="Timspurckia oligopyrenoides, Strain CCMP3278" /LENGTH=557 /DNA_ID=CAMNT_0024649667 /DNA_START=1 /DNA_END=1674 /DNA_ORIENTATION=-
MPELPPSALKQPKPAPALLPRVQKSPQNMVTPATWFRHGSPARERFPYLYDLLSYSFPRAESAFDRAVSSPLATALFNTDELVRNKGPILKFRLPMAREAEQGFKRELQLRCRKCDWSQHPKEWLVEWPFPITADLSLASAGVSKKPIKLRMAQRYTNGKKSGRDMGTSIEALIDKAAEPGAQMSIKIDRMPNARWQNTEYFVVYVQEIAIRTTKSLLEEIETSSLHRLRNVMVQRNQFTSEEAEKLSHIALERHQIVQPNNHDDLQLARERISLKCPLSFRTIETPARGVQCQHAQCFELEAFLQHSKEWFTYDCPVCNRRNSAHPSQLIISELFREALALRSGDDNDAIELLPDGTFQLAAAASVEPSRRNSTPAGAAAALANSQSGIESGSRPMKVKSELKLSGSFAAGEVIDLTGDSAPEDTEENGEPMRPIVPADLTPSSSAVDDFVNTVYDSAFRSIDNSAMHQQNSNREIINMIDFGDFPSARSLPSNNMYNELSHTGHAQNRSLNSNGTHYRNPHQHQQQSNSVSERPHFLLSVADAFDPDEVIVIDSD